MNSKNILQNKVDLYFKYFTKKDLNSLSSLFSDEIYLRDWEIEELGKNNVKKAFINIFNNVDKIEVNFIKNLQIDSRFYCEIEIIIDSSETLKVLDIIDFDKNNLICSIKAFKG